LFALWNYMGANMIALDLAFDDYRAHIGINASAIKKGRELT